jgi:hypothetical protein
MEGRELCERANKIYQRKACGGAEEAEVWQGKAEMARALSTSLRPFVSPAERSQCEISYRTHNISNCGNTQCACNHYLFEYHDMLTKGFECRFGEYLAEVLAGCALQQRAVSGRGAPPGHANLAPFRPPPHLPCSIAQLTPRPPSYQIDRF